MYLLTTINLLGNYNIYFINIFLILIILKLNMGIYLLEGIEFG